MDTILNEYRQMHITRAQLREQLGDDLHNVEVGRPVCIKASDVRDGIGRVLSGEKTLEELVDWVNVVWFTELFDFPDGETDSIISVLEVLETLDEDGVHSSVEELKAMQLALDGNKEYSPKERLNETL